MAEQDVRWIQRFHHFTKALGQLTKFIQKGKLNELEEQGLIQAFEYTYELAWNTLKDYLEAQGETEIHGSRDAFRLAFQRGLIEDGETWMDMVRSRTMTSHTYNEEIAKQISTAVSQHYFQQFVKLHEKMLALKEREE
jgi:nucleotidyltransferase substrate binding protein (TIGR01987 family)